MTDVVNFPVSEDLSCQELLAACAKKPWKSVLILGSYEGETLLRHATRMSNAEAVYVMELAKQIFLDMAHKVDLNTDEGDCN